MFGQSALIMLVVRMLLAQGAPWLQDWSEDKKAQVKAWVYAACPKISRWIPEEKSDAAAWYVVNSCWDAIMSIVLGELANHGVASMEIGHPKIWEAMGSAVAQIEEHIQAKADGQA